MIRAFLSQGSTPVSSREQNKTPLGITGRKVRVLAVVHGWMPYLAAGSERMVQHMLSALPPEEFDVEILSFGFADDRYAQADYISEGFPVTMGFVPKHIPDIIITHHGPGARVTQDLCEEFPNTRVITVFHNERFDIPDIQDLHAELPVFNTQWVSDALGGGGLVVRPPLEYDRHHVDRTGDCVTMVNLQWNKGVETFAHCADLMPETRFLGVLGTHGTQELALLDKPNVEIHPVTQDMKEVWARTKVVLMPSGYESFGMVAAEAQASGIPVIAHPTPGLVECLGGAGIFLPRERADLWAETLQRLLTDAELYREHSETASLRGLELVAQTGRELSAFVDEVRKLA